MDSPVAAAGNRPLGAQCPPQPAQRTRGGTVVGLPAGLGRDPLCWLSGGLLYEGPSPGPHSQLLWVSSQPPPRGPLTQAGSQVGLCPRRCPQSLGRGTHPRAVLLSPAPRSTLLPQASGSWLTRPPELTPGPPGLPWHPSSRVHCLGPHSASRLPGDQSPLCEHTQRGSSGVSTRRGSRKEGRRA